MPVPSMDVLDEAVNDWFYYISVFEVHVFLRPNGK